MIRAFLTLALLALTAPAIHAQVIEPDPAPPYLDTPDHWDIHGPNGDINFDIDAELWFSDEYCDYYWLVITGTVNGQPYTETSIAVDCGDGTVLDVYNGDSRQWTEWHWRGDHYEKVGGSAAVRTYHPAP